MANLIHVVFFPEGKPAEVREIADDFRAFRELVEGSIENVFLAQRPGGGYVSLVVNDEYLSRYDRPSLWVPPDFYRGGLEVRGPCVLTAYNEGGETCSLTVAETVLWRATLEPHRARWLREEAPRG